MRKSGKIVLSLVAVALSAAVFAPAGQVFATASVTKSAAKTYCKDWNGDWKDKDSKLPARCVNLTSKRKDACLNSTGGKFEKVKSSGKYRCRWDGGFKDKVDPDNVGSGPQDSDDSSSSENASKVIGGADPECGDGVKTSILGGGGCYTDDGKGSGVYDLLLIVLNILTAGVGVLGVLGLVISGVTYLTARDNEQQVVKAKSRILQIVIGLAVYALLYVGLQFIIPGGIFGK